MNRFSVTILGPMHEGRRPMIGVFTRQNEITTVAAVSKGSIFDRYEDAQKAAVRAEAQGSVPKGGSAQVTQLF